MIIHYRPLFFLLFIFESQLPYRSVLRFRDQLIASLHPRCYQKLFLRSVFDCRCDPATAGDRLSAYDGLTTHDSKLAHFCGLHNGPQVVSHGNQLLVHFQSDKDGRTAQGFAADYIFVLKWSVQPTKIIQEPMRGDQTSKAGPGNDIYDLFEMLFRLDFFHKAAKTSEIFSYRVAWFWRRWEFN